MQKYEAPGQFAHVRKLTWDFIFANLLLFLFLLTPFMVDTAPTSLGLDQFLDNPFTSVPFIA